MSVSQKVHNDIIAAETSFDRQHKAVNKAVVVATRDKKNYHGFSVFNLNNEVRELLDTAVDMDHVVEPLIADCKALSAQVVTLTQKLQVAEREKVVSDAHTAAHNTIVTQLKEQQQQRASKGILGLFASGRQKAAETTYYKGAAVQQPGATYNNYVVTENKNTHTGANVAIGGEVAKDALGSGLLSMAAKAALHARFGSSPHT